MRVKSVQTKKSGKKPYIKTEKTDKYIDIVVPPHRLTNTDHMNTTSHVESLTLQSSPNHIVPLIDSIKIPV